MQSRSEPLLWIQCLALGAIPLEILLLRLLLAGADPGPVPFVERLLTWGIGGLAPAIALWKRPADWGSVLVLRIPIDTRSSEQLNLSADQGRLTSRIPLLLAGLGLLPLLWWLDDTAVLVNEFSPLLGQSRLITLLLSVPVLAVLVWQLQQLGQAVTWLIRPTEPDNSSTAPFSPDQIKLQRSSFGLQLLNLPTLDWSTATAPATSKSAVDGRADAGDKQDQDQDQDQDTTEPEKPCNNVVDEAIAADPLKSEIDTPGDEGGHKADQTNEANNASPSAPSESVLGAAASLPVEPKQPSEEEKSSALDPEISQVDTVAGGSTEGHCEQAEPSGGKESQPEDSTQPPPGSL